MERLVASVQPYAWGDTNFIAELQARVPTGGPEAELWMGAHPKAPSTLASGTCLSDHIAADPSRALGDQADRHASLPFLKKVLAAAQPLSIQTHPTLAAAQAGFDREEAAGIARDAPTRTYRDANHKPKLICALTPFHAKCGFRPLDATADLLRELGEPAAPLAERLAGPDDAAAIAAALDWLLSGDPAIAPLVEAISAQCLVLAPATEHRWHAEIDCTTTLAELYPGDPGIAVALLLNHVILAPGEALFLEAGLLHAYMRGAGIEVMANSDNVIRGGLTPKHIDTAELARIVRTEPSSAQVQKPGAGEHTYDAPVPEFALTRIELDGSYDATVAGPEIVLATAGRLELRGPSGTIDLAAGQPVWIDAADRTWQAVGSATLFRTSVGDPRTHP